MELSNRRALPVTKRVQHALFLLATATLAPFTARAADSANGPAAQALFQAARKLAAQGNYAEACPKFEESERLESGLGTQFHLAKCWEAQGRSASAWALYLKVASQAKAQNQSERAAIAESRAKGLEPRLARLLVVVSGPTSGLQVRREMSPLSEASWNVPVPVDPGDYAIYAEAPGRVTFKAQVHVPDEPKTVTVVVPTLEPSSASKPAPDPSAMAQPPTGVATPSKAASSGHPGSPPRASTNDAGRPTLARPVGYALAGLGVLSVGTGVAFALDFKHVCSTREECQGSARDRARTDRTLAYAGWAVGGAALVGAAALLWLVPAESRAAAWLVLPECAPTGCGAQIVRSFQ